MALETQVNKVIYTGTGTTDTFSFPYYFLENSHLVVVERLIATGAETTLALNTDYTVSGAGEEAGGSVVLLAGNLPSTKKLIITREVPATQETRYLVSDKFPAKSHERALDKLTMLFQQLKEILDRAALFPKTVTNPAAMPELEAGKYLYSQDGLSIIMKAITETVTNYNATITTGIEADLPASPSVGDIYFAHDTGKIYVCAVSLTWTHYTIDINGLTAKTTLTGNDILLLEDSAASYAKKKVTLTNLIASISGLYKVKGSSGDASPDYLDGKVDGTSLEVVGDNLQIETNKNAFLESRFADKLMEVSMTVDSGAAIMKNGEVRVWGYNLKIGIGTGPTDLHIPGTAGLPYDFNYPAKKVVMSHSNIFVIDNLGWVWAAGLNAEGELADGTVTASYSFKRVGTLSGVSKIIVTKANAAATPVYAITETGSLYVWGNNTGGQLGVGTIINVTTPTLVSANDGNWTDIACSGTATVGHAIGLLSDGTIVATGINGAGQLGKGDIVDRTAWTSPQSFASPVAKIYAGGYSAATGYTLVVCEDGTLWGTGDNARGILCDGTTTDSLVFKQLSTITGVDHLAIGWEYACACAVKTDGTVRTWGANDYGQLGDGTATDRTTAYNPGLAGITKAVAAGTGTYQSFYLLRQDGTSQNGVIFAAGYGVQGNNGDGTILTAPYSFKRMIGVNRLKVKDIGAQGYSNVYGPQVLTTDGRIFICGSNTTGALGIGSVATPLASLVPVAF